MNTTALGARLARARPLRPAGLAVLLLMAGGLLAALGLGVGSTGVESLQALLSDPAAARIVWDIRAPRTVGACLTGALLGLAGAVAQGLFRNPLADPFLMGSASGASLAVALCLALLGTTSVAAPWLLRLGLTGAAFVGAMAAVALTLALARGVAHTLRLLLAGVVVGVVLGALTSLITLAVPEVLQAMQAFLLGSTGYIGWPACALMAGVALPCLLLAWAMSRALDGMALGEATAHSLGLPLWPMRVALIAVMALATGTSVAQTGLIAFVGLAAPHIVRGAVKTTHAWLLPLSGLMGGVLLMAADLLARGLLAPQELPVGVLTSILGGSYLLRLMQRRAG